MKTAPPLVQVCMLFGCCQVNSVLVSLQSWWQTIPETVGPSATEPCQASKWPMKRIGKDISSSSLLKFSKRSCREKNASKVN